MIPRIKPTLTCKTRRGKGGGPPLAAGACQSRRLTGLPRCAGRRDARGT